jgi:type II secretory pathway pseudopilin PulG
MTHLWFVDIVVAVIGALALIAVESWRRWGDGRRHAEAAAAERGQAYEAFVSDAVNALSTLHRLVGLAPRIGVLPLSAPGWQAARDARDAQQEVTRSHAHLRRLAPDDIAVAGDALLAALRHGAALTSARKRDARSWDEVWEEARAARIDFERLAHIDAAAPSAAAGPRRPSGPAPKGGLPRPFRWKPSGSRALLTERDVDSHLESTDER